MFVHADELNSCWNAATKQHYTMFFNSMIFFSWGKSSFRSLNFQAQHKDISDPCEAKGGKNNNNITMSLGEIPQKGKARNYLNVR